MSIQEYNEILDFAIQREREAVQFYRDLQKEAHFQGQLELLRELELMEQGHIAVIQSIKTKGVKEEDIPRVTNLKISEYLTVDADQLDLSYQNILIKAMKREEASFKLYDEMSRRFPDGQIANLFRKLAADEANHKLIFERMYDEWMSAGN